VLFQDLYLPFEGRWTTSVIAEVVKQQVALSTAGFSLKRMRGRPSAM